MQHQKTSFLFLILFLFLSFFTYSQKEASIWYFGEKAGLNFNNGSDIIVLDGEMETLEGCATISDADGNLLFYTNSGSHEWFVNIGLDGGTIWNKNHEPMYLMNGMEGGGYSAHQSSIILPKPNNQEIYYVMVIDEYEAVINNSLRGLSYYEVDMNLNGGLGAVTNYVESVYANTYEALSAVPMADESGFWVVIIDKDSKDILVFALTETGINLHGTYPGSADILLKFSPDGSKLFSLGYLYDFDKNTGVISNELELTTVVGSIIWAFSPNSRYLYSTTAESDSMYRYDLSVADINATETFLFSAKSDFMGPPQVAPDGNIYFIDRSDNVTPLDTAHLDAILCPNSENPCLKKGIYSFPSPNYSFNHLPNFNDHAFASEVIQVPLEVSVDASSLTISPGETVTLTANHYLADSFLWSTNENTQTITIEEAGMYSVTVSDGCCSSGTAEIEVKEDFMNNMNSTVPIEYVVSPNPTNEFFIIDFEKEQNFELTLLDATGRVVMHPVSYIQQARIDTRNLQSGSFWIKIDVYGKITWEQLIVVH